MALTAINKWLVYRPFEYPQLPSNTVTFGSAVTLQLNADTEYFFPVFYCGEAFTADKFEFYASTVTAAGNVDVRLYTVNTDGSPNTGVGSTSTVNITTTGRWEATGLNASLSAGTLYGIRVIPQAGVDVTLHVAIGTAQTSAPLGYADNTSGSVVAKGVGSSGMTIGIGDSSNYRKVHPAWVGVGTSGSTTQNISSTGTPFLGNKITFPAPCRIVGLVAEMASGTAGELRAILANAAGTAHRTSFTANTAAETSSSNVTVAHYIFDSPYEVAAAETVYCMMENTVAANRGIYYRAWSANASLDALWGKNNFYVTASALGTYTETNTRIAGVYPIIDQFHDGTGGSGLKYHPGMSGGLRG